MFRLVKKLEHSWKALLHDGVCLVLHIKHCMKTNYTNVFCALYLFFSLHYLMFPLQDTVSVHRPSFYADRFQKFMCNTVFKKPTCKFDRHIKTSATDALKA